MGVLADKVIDTYNYYNYEMQDPRAKDLFYLNTPWFLILLDGFYIYFVRSLGPKLMKDRPAFQLDGIIRIYNILQIVANTYLFYQGILVTSNERFNWRCMPIINDGSPYSIKLYSLAPVLFWLKVADLLDTVFFVLRKRFNQVSFLHVYHHAIMVFGVWMGLKYAPGGNPIVLVFVNTFVHIVMYSYYLLSSINKQYQKSVWWKKHLTQLQIVQFAFIALHTSQILIDNSCGYPYGLAVLLVIQTTFMTVLFLDFYRKAYLKKKAA